jgi:hypothetical protein
VKPTAAEVLRALVASLPRCDGIRVACPRPALVSGEEGGTYCDECAAESDPDVGFYDTPGAAALRAAVACLHDLDAEAAQAVVSKVVAENMPVGTTKRRLTTTASCMLCGGAPHPATDECHWPHTDLPPAKEKP